VSESNIAWLSRECADEAVPQCLSRTCFIKDCGYGHCWGCNDQKAERERIAAIITRVLTGSDFYGCGNVTPCRLCEKGFPIQEGVHYGTQSLGMIPSTLCENASYDEIGEWIAEQDDNGLSHADLVQAIACAVEHTDRRAYARGYADAREDAAHELDVIARWHQGNADNTNDNTEKARLYKGGQTVAAKSIRGLVAKIRALIPTGGERKDPMERAIEIVITKRDEWLKLRLTSRSVEDAARAFQDQVAGANEIIAALKADGGRE
jgi:hypothetical protein